MRPLTALAGFLLASSLTVSPAPARVQKTSEGEVTEVALESTSGDVENRVHFPTRVYKVVLRLDGSAAYVGKDNVGMKGSYRGVISAEEFKRLVEALAAQKFQSLKSNHPRPPGRLALPFGEPPVINLSVVQGGRRKTVRRALVMFSDQTKGAEEFALIVKAVDDAVSRVKWEKVK